MSTEKIQAAFKDATNCLAALERTIKKDYNTPTENIHRDVFMKIGLPSRYIRTANFFHVSFKLYKLVDGPVQRNNIAYSLQLGDLYDFFLNRFELWGVIRNLFLKTAITNIFSIQEAILYGSISKSRKFCVRNGNLCGKAYKCPVYLQSKGMTFNQLMILLEKKIALDARYINIMKQLKCIRDGIHIIDVEYSELAANELYSDKMYHEAQLTLRYLRLYLASKISEFEKVREAECLTYKPSR